MKFPYQLEKNIRISLGLIVLQADETVEMDARRLLSHPAELLVSRVPSGTEVTTTTLAEMKGHITASAQLFPRELAFDAVGYACTSGTSVIGVEAVDTLVRDGVATGFVTEPVSALLAACKTLGISRIAFLSPYVEEVSQHLRGILKQAGIDTSIFGSFSEANEAAVSRISASSIMDATHALTNNTQKCEAVFLSCTNMRTLGSICELEKQLNLPVLSSNLVLLWHMHKLAGLPISRQEFDCALTRCAT